MSQQTSLILAHDVEGAPVRIGEPMRISLSASEESLDKRFQGRWGIVVALVYDDPHRQYPHEPLVKVRVEDLGEDLFFPWELERSSEWFWRRLTGPGGAMPMGLHWVH
ncbi:Carotenogenesis protein CarS [Cystobacter fuscus]|uniref:Carotenogenesis protein CarS n=1 Tax=Cystobacter fuscus TaxID=43 RepID=UPI002B2D4B39|nr:Carotenogenesis protein CarS [Cystobacter fuscus]